MEVDLGYSNFSHCLRLNKILVESDLKIMTGFIEPHYFAGFRSGPKAVLPVLASFESVSSNHRYHMIAHPNACFKITDGNNMIWEEMYETVNEIDSNFFVNVT